MTADLLTGTSGTQHPLTSVLSRVRRHPATDPVLAGLLGLLISVIGIGVPSVWYDEAATISAATRSWPALWQMTGTIDAVHAAYYALMHVVFDVFGYSPVALRMPSAIAVGVAAALTVLLVRQFAGELHAMLSAVVFCLLPRVTWMGTEGRSYALTAALAVGMTLALVVAVRSGRKRWWVVYAAVIVLACSVFIYLALIVVAHAVTMAWWLAAARIDARRAGVGAGGTGAAGARGGGTGAGGASAGGASAGGAGASAARAAGTGAAGTGAAGASRSDASRTGAARSVIRWLIAAAAGAVCVVPLLLRVQSQNGQLGWIERLGPDTARQVFRTQWFLYDWWFAGLGWALIGVGAVLLARRSRGFSLAAIVLPLIVVPTAVLLVATEVYSPLYSPRYLTMCAPFAAIAIATPIAALRSRLGLSLAIAVVVALAIPAIVQERTPQAKQDSTWSEVAALIEHERAQDGPDATTAIIYGWVRRHPSATARVIEYSYPDAFRGTVDVTLTTPAAATDGLWERYAPIEASLDRLEGTDVAYLITSIKRDLRPATTAALESIGWRPTASWNLIDVNVVRYERAAG